MINWEKVKSYCIKKDEKLNIFDFDILKTLWFLKFSDKLTCETSEIIEQFKANNIIYLNLKKYYSVLKGQDIINENIENIIKGNSVSESEQDNNTNAISRTDPHEKQDNISLSTNDSKIRNRITGKATTSDSEKGLKALRDLQDLIENQNVYEKIVDKLSILYQMWKFECDI